MKITEHNSRFAESRNIQNSRAGSALTGKTLVPMIKMKLVGIISTLLTVFLLTAFYCPSNRLYLSGTVSSSDNMINNKIIGLYIFVKGDNKFITGDFVDSSKQYNISFIPENQPSFDFYIAGNGIDTTLLKSFSTFESDEMVWNIKLMTTSSGIKINETMFDDSAKIQLEHKAQFYYNYAKALNFIADGLKTKNEADSICFFLNKAHELEPDNVDVNNWLKEKCEK